MDYIIGVDGGGTKTEAIAYNLEGEELGRAYAGFGNLLLSFQEAYKNIEMSLIDCINRVEADYADSKCVFIYLGLAGIEAGNVKQKLKKALQEQFKIQVEAVNDAEIALAALLKGEDGILTISGTGSISYGLHNGKMERTGGWGHLLGDEGSGYYIAIQGFKTMIMEEDLDLPYSSLTKAFMNKLGINKVSDIKEFIYSSNKGDIAAFVPIIVEQAECGDERAKEILLQAGRDLGLTTYSLYKKLNFNGAVAVGIKGSILTKVQLVRKTFEQALKDNISEINIVEEDVSPAKGAFYLAKRLLENNNSVVETVN